MNKILTGDVFLIRIGKYLYIHWLFVALSVFCYINRQLETLVMSYFIILVHELSHLMAAKFIGLSCSNITIYPFGLNLKLKNTIIYSISDEIILYLSGPLSNILMALLSLIIGVKSDFYYKNLALFFINILPIIPLDGGMIIKKVLNYKLGYDGGNRMMRIISFFFFGLVLSFFSILLYMQKFNPSLCIFAIFLVGNMIFSKEKYDTNLLKELLYAREKNSKKQISKARIFGVCDKTSEFDIAKKFRPSERCFVFVTDNNNSVKKILSKEQIIQNLLADI